MSSLTLPKPGSREWNKLMMELVSNEVNLYVSSQNNVLSTHKESNKNITIRRSRRLKEKKMKFI